MRSGIHLIWLSLLLAISGCAASSGSFENGIAGETAPWSHEQFDDAEGKFTFAIITDLNGGEREGIFQVAVEQLNLLRPEFIISVGDIIDGASENEAGLHKEWDWFDERATKAKAPFFYVGGNHDLTSQMMRDVWAERYGPLYYHFVYKDVLFLALDTEDYTDERRAEIHEARTAAIKALDGPEPEKARDMEYFHMNERLTGAIGDEQAAYIEKAITDHPEVRWTFLFMHKPIWQLEEENNFNKIETALSDRPYTLFNGHFHVYSHTLKNDRDHIMLGTTGGAQNPENDAAFDQVTLVTVDEGDPAIATLRMDGILDKTGKLPASGEEMCFQASRCGEN